MTQPKQYLATGGKHVSSSFAASVNYFESFTPEQAQSVRDQIFSDFGENVIIDGSDNLHSPTEFRPEAFMFEYNKERFGVEYGSELFADTLAYYHSGSSGITNSGIVVSFDTYLALSSWYYEKYKKHMIDNRNKVYYNCRNDI